ncbi:MAG TPA: zinc-binding dehydrogenase [Anaeromyxobacter sp.]|nr:zinc-binding dehydrogenase [Anaeromyxobacter sp.]
MRAVAVMRPGEVRLVEVPVPEPGPYQALVENEVAAICNATDGKLVAGHFPGVDRYPLLLGHEGTGIVRKVGAKVQSFRVGDRALGGLVFDIPGGAYGSGWGGFCDYTLVNDHEAMVADGVADAAHGWFEVYEIQRRVAPDIPAPEAALLCTWREVQGGLGDFELRKGEDVLLFGAGPVGLSFVKLGKLFGLGWMGVVDPLPQKRERAKSLGADAVFSPDDPALENLPKTRGRPLDAVIDAVGNPRIVNRALPLLKLGGAMCIYGVLAEGSFTVEKEKGPYNFNLFVHQWPTRARERAAQEPLCEFIRQGRLKASEFVTHEFPVERVGEALKAVASGEVVKCLLWY